jgi:hypothetical protein
MSIFLAWVIVGFCSFLIQQHNFNKVLPKYAFGILVADKIETHGKGEAYNPDMVAALDFYVRLTAGVISIIIAPFTLYRALMSTFGFRQGKIEKIKKKVDEIVRKRGQLIF